MCPSTLNVAMTGERRSKNGEMNMSIKNWTGILPQGFDSCVPGIWITFFGGLLMCNPLFLVIGSILIVIPAVIVIVRRVVGG